MVQRFLIVGALSLTAMAAGWACTALAAGSDLHPGDPAHGHELAQAFCAECHQVGEEDDVPGRSEAPGFPERAKDPATTPLALRVFLQTPHWEMPNILLSPEQADDIIAYILSLKRS